MLTTKIKNIFQKSYSAISKAKTLAESYNALKEFIERLKEVELEIWQKMKGTEDSNEYIIGKGVLLKDKDHLLGESVLDEIKNNKTIGKEGKMKRD